MVIVVIILQQIDANIINPKILGNSLKISPLLVIFAVPVGGAYFGFWGMFLSVPIVAVIKLLLTDYIEYKNNLQNEEVWTWTEGTLKKVQKLEQKGQTMFA